MTNRYYIALGVPVILLICGALARKLVRGSSWRRSDFFLGVEFTLAAMSAALVYLFDLAKPISPLDRSDAFNTNSLAATAGFLAVCFLLLLWVLSVHQDWEWRDQNPRAQFVWLGIMANAIGAGLLTAFILLVKGIH